MVGHPYCFFLLYHIDINPAMGFYFIHGLTEGIVTCFLNNICEFFVNLFCSWNISCSLRTLYRAGNSPHNQRKAPHGEGREPLTTGTGNTPRRKSFHCENHIIPCHNLPAHSRPVPLEICRNSKPISHPEVSARIRPFPCLSAYGSGYGSARSPEVTGCCGQPDFRR